VSDSFDSFIQQAWRDHAEQAPAVAERLSKRAQVRLEEGQLSAFVRLLVHVFGEHLGRWDEGIALLRRLGPLPAGDGTVARAVASLEIGAGRRDAGQDLPPAERIAARAVASSALLARGERERAIDLLRQASAEAATSAMADDAPAVRALAVAGNNLAAGLEDLPDRTPDQTAAMVEAARTGLAQWRRCGTWLEHERAEYRLARSLLRAGQPAQAAEHARQCLAICQANAAPAFERFFGHALAALCASATHDEPAFDADNEAALQAWAAVDADELVWCQDALAELRAATGGRHAGRCTCGAVRFRLASAPLFVHACHCRWCQRETGTAFATNAIIETERLQSFGEAPVLVHTPSASGRGQQVARCAHCQVALWSHYSGAGQALAFVRVGTLLDPDRLPPDIHIFTSTRRPDVRLPEGVPAVPAYYEREQYWPAASLERRRALLERLKPG
jgi:hypothetical protein